MDTDIRSQDALPPGDPRARADRTRLNYQALRAGWDTQIFTVLLCSDPVNTLLPWQQRYLSNLMTRKGRRGSWIHATRTMQKAIGVEEIDRALDILSARGVPLDDMSMRCDLGKVGGRDPVTGGITELGAFAGAEERHSAGHAFAHDWIMRFCEIFICRPVEYARYVDRPEMVTKLFFSFVEEWATAWKERRPAPSRACIDFCRRFIDRSWKHRAYGESVTTLFLTRFALEIAWARRARYHFRVDELASFGMGDKAGFGYRLETEMLASFEKAVQAAVRVDYDMEYRGDRAAASPVVIREMVGHSPGASVSAADRKQIEAYGLTVEQAGAMLATEGDYGCDGGAAYWESVEASRASCPPALSPSDKKMRAAVPGILASVFLDHAAINPDHTFIFMLLAFVEAEAGRTNVPLLPRHHPAYRIPARGNVPFEERLAARLRGIEARRKSAVEHLDEYARFGWFHVAACRTVPSDHVHSLQGMEVMPELTAMAKMPYEQRLARKRKFPPLERRKRLREREASLPKTVERLDLSGRFGILHCDSEALGMARSGWGRALLSSPTIKASRFAYANKRRSASERMKYVHGLATRDSAFRGVVRSDYGLIYNGAVMPELIDIALRKSRNEFRCGLARYGFSGVDRLTADLIATADVRLKLICLSAAAPESRFCVALNSSVFGRHFQGSERYLSETRRLLARDPMLIHARSDARTDFDIEPGALPTMEQRRTGFSDDPVAVVSGMSFRKMMSLCRRILMKGHSDYPFISGASDYRVFAAWKRDVEVHNRVTSRNVVLSYLDYVIRRAAWSGPAADVMTGTIRGDRPPVTAEGVMELLA